MASMQTITPCPALSLPPHQWVDIIQYLEADDLKSLRLSGSKKLCLWDPLFTSHLNLRMDLIPFFGADRTYTARAIRRWLHNRKRLVINNRGENNMHPARVACLVKDGYLNSISEIVVYDCSLHGNVISQLVMLPNVQSFKLVDRYHGGEESYEDYVASVQQNLEGVVESLRNMTSLEMLEIELDCVVSGRHLSALQGMKGLKSLRLKGFDFSEGVKHIGKLTEIENLHLCHGSYYNSPEKDIIEEDLLELAGLTQIKSINLQGFDNITGLGLEPLRHSSTLKELVFRHCQDLSADTCAAFGTMTSLNSLHVINNVYEDIEDFESEHLLNLLPLKELKTLSLFYVLIDQYDILDLEGLDALETLNVAFTVDMSQREFDILCKTILPILPSLKKVRIFGEDFVETTMTVGNFEVEIRSYNLGDTVELD